MLNLHKGTEQAHFSEFVFEQLKNWRKSGIKTALLTLVNIEGSSPRPIGSQLAVNEQGDFVGLISGGCLEAALVAEAQLCIHQKSVRCVRYGLDSDYFDIQLPCGSGVDILIQPLQAEDTWLEEICSLYQSRKPFTWQFNLTTQINTIIPQQVAPQRDGISPPPSQNRQLSRKQMDYDFKSFQKLFSPQHRVVVMGEGEVFNYFIQLSQVFDLDVLAYTNNPAGISQYLRIADWNSNILDSWSSLVILSHDHSWEQPILLHALASDVSFISALGSKKTHSKRLQLLRSNGIGELKLKLIKGPAGLDIGGKNPPEIALSILSEVIYIKNNRI